MEAPPERRAPVPAAAEPVYRLAGALGSELQRLSGLFGPGAVAGLVPQVVRLLELLEALAAGGPERDEGPARARQLQEAGEPSPGPTRDLAQALELRLAEAQERERLLQSHLAQAEAENQRLLAQLAGTQSQEESTQRREKEVMLRLKEVVDKQRDEIRAQAHEILCKARDTEALQEQLNRFMTVNEEIRRKLAIVQAQLQSALQRKEDLESALLEARQEVERLSKAAGAAKETLRTSTMNQEVVPGEELPGSGHGRRSYSKEELQQILQERNELKTSLFLVQEELAYYQRELLNDERIPSLLLDAVKSTIKKQRRKIRAKMLGTAEEPLSSDEEEEGVWLASPTGSDCVDSRLPESKIRSFFGLWYRGSSKSSSPEDCPGAWEIVDPQDVGPEEEEEEEEEQGGREASCSFSPPSGPSPFP